MYLLLTLIGELGKWLILSTIANLFNVDGFSMSSVNLITLWSVSKLARKGTQEKYGVDHFKPLSLVTYSNSIFKHCFCCYQSWLATVAVGCWDASLWQPRSIAQWECSKVCHLKKAIYGLKLNLFAWCDKLSQVLLRVKVCHQYVDHSL